MLIATNETTLPFLRFKAGSLCAMSTVMIPAMVSLVRLVDGVANNGSGIEVLTVRLAQLSRDK